MLIFQLLELISEQARQLRRALSPVPYKAVLLDLDGVYLRHGDPERITDIVQLDTSLTKLYQDYELGLVTFKEFFDMVKYYFPAKATGLTAKQAAEKVWGPRDQNIARAIKALRENGYKVGLIANVGFFDEAKEVAYPGSLDDFDVCVESCREGVRKPHHEIYERAVARLGLSPTECIYIDDLVRNCRGAELSGMKSLRVFNQNTESAVRELSNLTGLQL